MIKTVALKVVAGTGGMSARATSQCRGDRRNGRQRWIGSRAMVVALVVGLLGFVLLGGAASGATANKKLSLLQRGLAYYSGKTITFIDAAAVGSGFDVDTRDAVPFMESYLHATINIENVPNASGVQGEDEIAAAGPTGLTIGFFNLGSIIYNLATGAPGLNFNPARETFLGGVPGTPQIIATQSSTPFTSLASLHSISAGSPVKMVTSGGAGAEAITIMKALGIPTYFVTGYTNGSAATTGFLRGDGQLIVTQVQQLLSEINAGSIRAIALLNTPKSQAWSALKGVPSIQSYLKANPPKTALEKKAVKVFDLYAALPNFALGTATRVPPAQVTALVAAVKFALTSPTFQSELATIGSEPGYITGPTLKTRYVKALANVRGFSSILGVS